MIYRLVDYYDVWGNEEDGWEVNDVIRTDIVIELDDKNTGEDVIDELIYAEYLYSAAKDKIRVDWFEPEFIELFNNDNDYPLGRLEAIG